MCNKKEEEKVLIQSAFHRRRKQCTRQRLHREWPLGHSMTEDDFPQLSLLGGSTEIDLRSWKAPQDAKRQVFAIVDDNPCKVSLELLREANMGSRCLLLSVSWRVDTGMPIFLKRWKEMFSWLNCYILSPPLPPVPWWMLNGDVFGHAETHLWAGDPEKAISLLEHACLLVCDLVSHDLKTSRFRLSDDAIAEGPACFWRGLLAWDDKYTVFDC